MHKVSSYSRYSHDLGLLPTLRFLLYGTRRFGGTAWRRTSGARRFRLWLGCLGPSPALAPPCWGSRLAPTRCCVRWSSSRSSATMASSPRRHGQGRQCWHSSFVRPSSAFVLRPSSTHHG